MARTDFEPLSWEEAEQNRREALSLSHPDSTPPGVLPAVAALLADAPNRPSANERAARLRNESPAERCERLRSEIKRGRDYLEQAEQGLAESRALLEDWPAYEQTCGKNPLAHLTQSVLLNARITYFLAGWLKRREAELEALTRPAGG